MTSRMDGRHAAVMSASSQASETPNGLACGRHPTSGFWRASWGDRQFPGSCSRIAAAQYCEDRFKGLDDARERIGRSAQERGKHVEGVVQFFKMSLDDAKAALGST
jgi:hypothetical protein